jgi:hypothetical protein
VLLFPELRNLLVAGTSDQVEMALAVDGLTEFWHIFTV